MLQAVPGRSLLLTAWMTNMSAPQLLIPIGLGASFLVGSHPIHGTNIGVVIFASLARSFRCRVAPYARGFQRDSQRRFVGHSCFRASPAQVRSRATGYIKVHRLTATLVLAAAQTAQFCPGFLIVSMPTQVL